MQPDKNSYDVRVVTDERTVDEVQAVLYQILDCANVLLERPDAQCATLCASIEKLRECLHGDKSSTLLGRQAMARDIRREARGLLKQHTLSPETTAIIGQLIVLVP